VLIVSHDRTFLDRVVNRVVALDPRTHMARLFAGGYSDYLATLESERSKQTAQWRDQEVEIARLEADEQRWKDRALKKENATNNDHQRRLAKKVAKRGKAKEKRLEQYLASDERVEKPEREWQVKLDFGEVERTSREVLTLDHLTIGYDTPLLTDVNLTLQAGERIAIMGPNGHGKSTLLKTILGEIPALSGRVRAGASVQPGYLAQEQEILDPRSTPLDTLQHEAALNHTEARSFLHFFLFGGDDVFRRNADLSYGERSRLMLALLVARGANLLIMDEPLNHLDLPSREKFEHAMQSYQGSVLAVMHDRYFVEKFATAIWYIENGTLTVQHVRAVV
jgi:ATP-binding cassette subfamily F protein 3